MRDSRRVVVDANVVVKWIVPEDYSEDALKLRDDLLEGVVEVHAPSFLLLEVANAFRKYCLRGILDAYTAEKALDLLAKCGLSLHEVEPSLALTSLRLSLDYGVTVYDAAYIALALNLKTRMYTADGKLLNNEKLKELKTVEDVRRYTRGGR